MNKKLSMVLVAILTLGLCGSARAIEGIKIGYVDLEKIFNEYYRTKDENAKLQDVQTGKKNEADRMISDINKLKEEAELLSDDAKKSKEAIVKEKIRELRDYEKDTVQEIRDKLLGLRKDILDEITKVVEDKGKKEGYTFIFVSDVIIYKEAGLDVTQELISMLNKGHEVKAAPPAGSAPASAAASTPASKAKKK